MLSSTSNSKLVPADIDLRGLWRRALGLAALGAIAIECLLRTAGHEPSVNDDKVLWSMWRGMASASSKRNTAVIAGSSRALLDIDLTAFEKAAPGWRCIQLAVDGTWPLTTVEELATCDDFRGLVLVDLDGVGLLEEKRDSQARWPQYFSNLFGNLGWVDKCVNHCVVVFLQSTMCLWTRGVGDLVRQHFRLRPSYLQTGIDRQRLAYYRVKMTERELARHRAWRLERRRDEYTEKCRAWAEVEGGVARLATAVRRIQSRGGSVVLVRLPTSDEHLQMDNTEFPRALFWDRLAQTVGCPTVHFQDYRQLASFECPDTSHLDAKDTTAFTERLVQLAPIANALRRSVTTARDHSRPETFAGSH